MGVDDAIDAVVRRAVDAAVAPLLAEVAELRTTLARVEAVLAVASSASAPVYLKVSEAAARFGYSERTIRRLVRRGDLRAVRVGRSLRIPADALASVALPEAAE